MKQSIERIQSDDFSALLVDMKNAVKYSSMIYNAIRKNDYYCVGLSRSDIKCQYLDGMIKTPSEVIDLNHDGITVVDMATHKMLSVNGKDVSGVENRVLDLSDEGERWEGDVLDNQPYGWGILYDKEGEKAYEGFRIGDVTVCYGTQYYADIQKVEYEGMIHESKRWGKGVQYDRNGAVVFDGEWLNDGHEFGSPVQFTGENTSLHSLVRELVVCNECCNEEEWKVLDFSFAYRLESLQVGNDCFQHVDEVSLVGLKHLVKVEIGNNSFVMKKKVKSPNVNGMFLLEDCAALTELKIGSDSFSEYVLCKIENLPSLETIVFGSVTTKSFNFMYSSLSLKGRAMTGNLHVDLRQLKTVSVGSFSFYKCSHVVFEGGSWNEE